MKLLVSLALITLIGVAIYFVAARPNLGSKKAKPFKVNRKALMITLPAVLVLVVLLGAVMYKTATQPDVWCGEPHTPLTVLPAKLKTAQDYFLLGDYDYETGNCQKAVTDYTSALKLNSKLAQVYNNRAYTYMRLRNYQVALTDLNAALKLNPNYIQALMNRGDIYNYYLVDRPKAIIDYQKVLALKGSESTSVCGHLFLAQHDGWNLGTVLGLPFVVFNCR
jgi:tetratricopeptide (TPR) repeat protein